MLEIDSTALLSYDNPTRVSVSYGYARYEWADMYVEFDNGDIGTIETHITVMQGSIDRFYFSMRPGTQQMTLGNETIRNAGLFLFDDTGTALGSTRLPGTPQAGTNLAVTDFGSVHMLQISPISGGAPKGTLDYFSRINPNISSVPEPATMVLLGTCLAGLGILKRKTKI